MPRVLLQDALYVLGVELSEYDKRIVDWLAGWDWPTVGVIVPWLRRAQNEGAQWPLPCAG